MIQFYKCMFNQHYDYGYTNACVLKLAYHFIKMIAQFQNCHVFSIPKSIKHYIFTRFHEGKGSPIKTFRDRFLALKI